MSCACHTQSLRSLLSSFTRSNGLVERVGASRKDIYSIGSRSYRGYLTRIERSSAPSSASPFVDLAAFQSDLASKSRPDVSSSPARRRAPEGPARKATRRLKSGEVIGFPRRQVRASEYDVKRQGPDKSTVKATSAPRLTKSGKPDGRLSASRRSRESRHTALEPAKDARPRRPKATDPLSPDKEDPKPKKKELWMIRKAANKEKYPTGYQPRKRLSPDAIAGIRALHAQFPDVYDAANLARQFGVEYDAVGRILKSRWRPSEEAEEEMRARWERRGQRVWGQIEQVEGIQPPSKWRRKGMKIDPLGDA